MINIKLIGTEKLVKLSQSLRQKKADLNKQIKDHLSEFGNSVIETAQKDYLSGSRPEKLGVRSGVLRSSLRLKFVEVGTSTVQLKIGSIAKYAAIHEYGGKTSPHTIVPKKKDFLSFIIGNKRIFTKKVNHPGSVMRKRPFLTPSVIRHLPDLKKNLMTVLTGGISIE